MVDKCRLAARKRAIRRLAHPLPAEARRKPSFGWVKLFPRDRGGFAWAGNFGFDSYSANKCIKSISCVLGVPIRELRTLPWAPIALAPFDVAAHNARRFPLFRLVTAGDAIVAAILCCYGPSPDVKPF